MRINFSLSTRLPYFNQKKKQQTTINPNLQTIITLNIFNNIIDHRFDSRMVSNNSNQSEPFNFDPAAADEIPPAAMTAEDLAKKSRKPYTITKSRESWSEPEHDKFLEALQLFDRDWKKIEAFIGSKTVIQVQKNGTNEHLPPPRPKRKAAHPYPHKASKNDQSTLTDVTGPSKVSSALVDSGYTIRPDSSPLPRNPITGEAASSWTSNSLPNVPKGDLKPVRPAVITNSYSMTDSTPEDWSAGEINDQRNNFHELKVMPDFAQVYSFIGSVFDPNTTGHLQKLKNMDPIDLETALLLMRNLSINLTNPDFEDHRKLISSYEVDSENGKSVA